MKRKIILTLAMVLALASLLALSVFAEEKASVHNGKVDLDATVTLDSGAVCNLFDSEGNALIWYYDASGALQSIRADDQRVKYRAADWGVNIYGATGPEMLAVSIVLDDATTIDCLKIAVFNIMDDDVVTNDNASGKNLNMPITCMKEFIRSSTDLEYVYLRLDTIAVMATAFADCTNLKYVNLESLTELRRIGGGSVFRNCTSLFEGEVLDLTKTKLASIDGGGVFAGVSLVGIKLPSTCTSLGTWAFQDCKFTEFAFPIVLDSVPAATFKNCRSLTAVYLNNTVKSIGDEAFLNNNALNTVFFVGTLDELNALLDNTATNGNTAFWNVVGEDRANLISYADYLALEDKSGKYAVYGYSYCEAYNEGNHEMSGNAVMQEVDFFKDITFADTCTVCNIKVIDESKTIGAIFKDYGYSITEVKIGDKLAMSQFFGVDDDNLKEYTDLTGESFEYGIVVSSNADPLNEANAGLIAAGKTHITKEEKIAHDYIVVSVAGFITEGEGANADKGLAFCMFIKDGEKTSYLDNGKTVEVVEMKSYNDIAVLAGNK